MKFAGLADVPPHHIETGDARPIRCKPYRRSFEERKVLEKEIERLLRINVIEPTS